MEAYSSVNILDENIAIQQREQLREWRIPVRQIGPDIAHLGIKDAAIIPLLHQLHQPTFFTLDDDFYKRYLCHARYCLIYLDVDRSQAAEYVRRVLRHPEFNTIAKRLGTVLRASSQGLTIWRLHAIQEESIPWTV